MGYQNTLVRHILKTRSDLLLVVLFACTFILGITLFAKLAINTTTPHNQARLAAYNQQFGITAPTPPLVSWDSQWYANIAQHGYTATELNNVHNIAFLPLYPIITRTLQTFLPINIFTAGLLTAYGAYIIAMILLYEYARQVWKLSQQQSFAAIVAISIFPMGFILTSMYADSLFLALILATFLLHHKKRYGLAALTALLATATRINGITLTIAFALAAYVSWKKGQPALKQLWPAITPLIFLIAFAAYSQAVFGNPLQYVSAKQTWFARTGITTPWQTLVMTGQRLIKAAGDPVETSTIMVLELPLLAGISFATYLLWKRQRATEAAYLLANLGLVLFSGTLWGLPRYSLALFPLFLLFAAVQKPVQSSWYAYIIISLPLQVFLIIQFTNLIPPAP